MSVSYPLALPASPPGFASVELSAESLVGFSASPFTAQQQIYEWAGNFWRAKCALPPMARANAERWLSFLLSLRGMSGTFLLGDPLGKTPQSTAGGSPIVNGALQVGKQLAISGLTGVLKAGDYFHIGSAGENLLLWSQAFDNAAWSRSNIAAPTADTIVAPDGTTTAEALIASADAFTAQTILLGTALSGALVTFSVWLKVPSGTKTISIFLSDFSGGSILGQSVALTTTWQRFSVTKLIGAITGNGPVAQIGGGGTWTTGEVDVWGGQLERGAVVNNYITTTTLASGPTRQLLKNLVDAGPGTVTLDIFPKLRTAPLNADPLILTNSVGLFRLASNSMPWSVDKAKFYGISFEAVEAL